jgi:hypothetical protein
LEASNYGCSGIVVACTGRQRWQHEPGSLKSQAEQQIASQKNHEIYDAYNLKCDKLKAWLERRS